ncbi:MAG: SH3 domain-containing protein [Bacteroidia bacterium]
MRVVSGYFLIGFIGWILAVSCQGNSATNQALTLEEDLVEADSNEIPIDKIAVCVWDVAGLREEAGKHSLTKDKKNNYLEAIYYGEQVEMLGEEKEMEGENRTYMKVRLKDGQEGWVHDYLFEKNARLAATADEIELYRRPDMMTLRDDKLLPGEIIVTMEKQGEWIHVSGREKKKKGWIKIGSGNLAFQARDVKLALLYYRAIQDRSDEGRKEKLNKILSDKTFSGSVLIDLVEYTLKNGLDVTEANREMNGIASPKDQELYITVSETQIYSTPDTISIIKELKKGDKCMVLGKGEQEEIRDMKDYWYRVKHENEEGWVYGYYTSMRAPK